jgi:photosystem II stability/assembly factor-like uncharacterized protein
MKKKILISSLFIVQCSLFTVPCSLAQQYGWIDLSANIPDSANYIRDVYFIGQEGWVTGGYSSEISVYYTSNGGQYFTSQNVPAGSGSEALSIFMRSPLEGYIVTNLGHILRTTDGGNIWSTVGTNMGLLYSVSFPPLPRLSGFACSGNGSVYKITGSTIVQDYHLTGASFYSVCFPVNSDEGWVIGGTVLRHRTAAGWQDDQNYNGSKSYNAIHFIDNLHGWAVGYQIIIRTLNGIDWVTQNNPDNNNLMDVFFLNTQEGWAVGNNVVLYTADGGITWTEEDESMTDSTLFTSVFALNSHEVYVTGQKQLKNDQYQAVLLKYTQVNGMAEQQKPGISLCQNQPNPFSGSTVISWQSTAVSHVLLKVYNFLGKEVQTLADTDVTPGEYNTNFDASALPAGVYFYQIQGNGMVETKKMVVCR